MTDSAPLIALTTDSQQRSVTWAVEHLTEILQSAGLGVNATTGGADPAIRIHAAETDAASEAFSIDRPDGGTISISGGSGGVTYGLLELADRVRYAADAVGELRAVKPEQNEPATPVRSISRVFSCEVEDKPWYYDRGFWTEYLTELATNRVNRLQLAFGMQYNYGHHPAIDNYFCFLYPFLLDVPGFDVHAGAVSENERTRNLETLHFISDECARRGIHFQLGLWNHAYDQGEGSRPTHPIDGLTPETHADYCAAALAKLLAECPAINGLTIRVHYEGGVPEPGHEFWRTVMAGTTTAGRRIEIDMHAKGVDQGLLDTAGGTGQPVVVSAKYWAEHQGLPYHQTTIRDREKATKEAGSGLMSITAHLRRFTRYGYGDFLRENRDFDLLFRIWPGTQRVLLWGDPELAAGYGRLGTIGGAMGIELCEPLTFKGRKGTGTEGGRDPYADPELRLDGQDWLKYKYTYRLWGRLLYDPDADPESWRRFLRAEYGAAALAVEGSLGAASRVLPLMTVVHGLGASNNGYWPEMYVNMPIADGPNTENYRRDTAEPPTFGGVSSFDPSRFYTVDEYAQDVLAGRHDGRYSPDEVAGWLESLSTQARERLEEATDLAAAPQAPTFRRLAVDVLAQAQLGTFFAEKLRAGLAYSLYQQGKDPAQLAAAFRYYSAARQAWADLAESTSVYRDDLTFGHLFSEHGHWKDRLPDIDADLADIRDQFVAAGKPDPAAPPAIREPAPSLLHQLPEPFVPGTDIPIEIAVPSFDGEATLHYRHLNQGEDFQQVAMSRSGDIFQATIPGRYSNSEFPLVYFFVLRESADRAWIRPGLETSLADQPYHVLRQKARHNAE